jgi:hypothetical protein
LFLGEKFLGCFLLADASLRGDVADLLFQPKASAPFEQPKSRNAQFWLRRKKVRLTAESTWCHF